MFKSSLRTPSLRLVCALPHCTLNTYYSMKDKLQDLLGGLSANKQKLQTTSLGVLKDNLSLAYYNFKDGENVMVGMKERGGRKK